MTTATLPRSRRAGRTAIAGFGLLWSLFGVSQFLGTALSNEAALMGAGMTPAQASLYASLPLWMDLAFALGVFGGTIGSALLLFGRREALPVLVASLAGYLVLYAGDIALGVFAAFGIGQVAILSFVVAIAALLVATARLAR